MVSNKTTLEKTKPDWAGEDWLSRLVNVLIGTKPIYAVMKQQARRVLIKTAEKNGIAWRERTQELEQSGAKALLEEVTNTSVEYPDYYQVPFHAYDDGNLCWKAAFEAESATLSMGLRVWRNEPGLTWQAAQDRLRGSFHAVLDRHCHQPVRDALDMGCSIGASTITLHRYLKQFGDVRTVGLDLSPYMLAVATIRDAKGEISEWRHGLAEATGFDDDSFDLVTLQFVIHELPREATQSIMLEAKRILRPGGILAIVDNNPSSPVIQNLPPVLFTLMKSTEPWSDDFYTFDVESALHSTGFDYLETVASDPRHRTIVSRKPG